MTLLEAKDLAAGYGDRRVIERVSLKVDEGRTLGIVGPNAAGKSTLLRALCGATPPLAGEVLARGVPLNELAPRDRARLIALVPQSARFDLDFSVREIVAMGRAPHMGGWGLERPEDREAIDWALHKADVDGLAARAFSTLSGGERQRTLLARALAQHAPLLLLDEPTAHLDLAHQWLVLEVVQRHARLRGSAVVVLHDLTLAARLDELAVIDGGRLVAHGTPQEVLTRQRLARTWGIDGALEQTSAGLALVMRGRK